MEKIKKLFNNKLNIYLFMISPIIDVLTGLMTLQGYSVTIGIIIKVFQLFLATGYILFVDKENKAKNLIYLTLLFVFFTISILNNIDVIKLSAFSYLNYIFKFNYFSIMILYFYRYLHKNPNINLRVLSIPIIIFTLFILFSNITSTSFATYANRLGNSSWYYSANEYSANLSILFPIVIYIFIDRLKPDIFSKLIFLVFAYGIISCGTKATLISMLGCLFGYVIYKILISKKIKLGVSFVLTSAILIILILNFSKLPTIINMKTHYDNIVDSGETSTENRISRLLFSERDSFLKRIENYDTDVMDFLVGKAYIYEGNIDIIESDIFDVYYMYGIIGFILVYGLFFYLIIKQIIYYIKNFKEAFYDSKYTLVLVSALLVILTSLVAGHTISSPSVAVFVAFIMAKINVFETIISNDKKILYVSEYDNNIYKIIKNNDINNIIIIGEKPSDNKIKIKTEIINSDFIKSRAYILKMIFLYSTGLIKYEKSFMLYHKDKNKYFDKLCYLSSMNSTLLISKNDYKDLKIRGGSKFNKECFQEVKFID